VNKKAKIWILLSAGAATFIVMPGFFSQPISRTSAVHAGYAGLSLRETNAVLFTVTNDHTFPITFDVFTVNTPGLFARRKHGARGEAFPKCTYTFHVDCPSPNGWRLTGCYYVPRSSPLRSRVGVWFNQIGMQRIAGWFACPAPKRVEIAGIEMTGGHPK
jgi:hypothetical protein